MADVGHVLTDEQLKKLEKAIAREYKIAVDDMETKLAAYLQETEAGRKKQESLLNAGKITQKEYSDWCYRHNMIGKRWEEMRDTLAADMHHTNEIAMKMIKGKMPDVYALNGNYATYEIERQGIDTGFTLYNHATAEYLLGDQRQLMPKPSARKAAQIAANKDMQWNKEKIQSAVLQGVLQGESPYKVADRLMQVGQMNYNSSVRYARTMTTSAQNAGRYEAYRRATRLGVDLTIEWAATLDGRTRHDHRMMHGQQTTVDEPFRTPDGFTIYYPADCTGESTAPQDEIWNCRCTLLAWVKGFEGETVKEAPAMGNMTFEEWQHELEQKREETFADKIGKITAGQTGSYTPEQIQSAGNILAEEYQRMVSQNAAQREKAIAESQSMYDAALAREHELEAKLKDRGGYYGIKDTLTAEEQAEYRKILYDDPAKALDNLLAVKREYRMTEEKQANWLASKIAEVRPVGAGGIDLKGHLLGDSEKAKTAVEYAYSKYPTAWVQASAKKGSIYVGEAKRGYYNHGQKTLILSGKGKAFNSTAIHEIAHRFEDTVGGLLKEERRFYNERTDGISSAWMGKGYDKTEVTKADNFVDKYMGIDYGGKGYELYSMGFQLAYTDPDKLAKDPEMQSWVYGSLLLL